MASQFPQPFDSDAAASGLAEWQHRATTLDDPEAFPAKGSTWEEEKLSWVGA